MLTLFISWTWSCPGRSRCLRGRSRSTAGTRRSAPAPAPGSRSPAYCIHCFSVSTVYCILYPLYCICLATISTVSCIPCICLGTGHWDQPRPQYCKTSDDECVPTVAGGLEDRRTLGPGSTLIGQWRQRTGRHPSSWSLASRLTLTLSNYILNVRQDIYTLISYQ